MATTDFSHPPLISVLMPVYNGAAYLSEAVESVLNQTYRNFELIIINDGSTDQSAFIIEQYRDPRIRFLSQTNHGLAATLNRAVDLSQGKYLARQDQDDISFPTRFERQVEFLESHRSCGLVGTWAEIWVAGTRTRRTHRHPADNLTLKFELLFDNPFVHSSVMIRKEVFAVVGNYCTDKDRQPPEDYELWSRVARQFEVANIPEILQVYREMPCSMSRTGANPFLDKLINLSAENLALLIGDSCPAQQILELAALSHGACERLSARPDLRLIARLLHEAAARLSRTAPESGALLSALVKKRLNFVRRRYLRWKIGAVAAKLKAFGAGDRS